jgi:hypothetical protein
VDRSPEDSIRAYLSFLADPSASLDSRDIARLEKLVASTADPVEKLRLAAQLEQAKTPDGTVLQADFIRHARSWADTEGIPASAFRQLGVSDDVLRKAGVLKGGRGVATRRRAAAERTGRRVTVEDIKAWALTQPDIFTIKDVTQAIGGSLVTANKALQELVVEGTISNLGPAEDHKGPGRAPARFAVAKRRKARA